MRILMQTDVGLPGESWLWESKSHKGVIDIGQSDRFGIAAARFEPDVVVLTHDDADHIGSWRTFFAEINGPSFELWVPADWGRVLQALNSIFSNQQDPLPAHPSPNETDTRFDADVEDSTADDPPDRPANMPQEDTHENFGAQPINVDESLFPRAVNMRDDLVAAMADAIRESREEEWNEKLEGRAQPGESTPHQIATRLGRGLDLNRTTPTVLEILRDATVAGIPVRWFDVDLARHRDYLSAPWPWKCEGCPGTLTVINARQRKPGFLSTPIRDGALSLAMALYLTTQNERALSTFVWPDCRTARGGALIWSDASDEIAGCAPWDDCVPWEWTGVMSAPHHASKATRPRNPRQPPLDKRTPQTSSGHQRIWDARCFRAPWVFVVLSNNAHKSTNRWTDLDGWLRACMKCAQAAQRECFFSTDVHTYGPSVFGCGHSN